MISSLQSERRTEYKLEKATGGAQGAAAASRSQNARHPETRRTQTAQIMAIIERINAGANENIAASLFRLPQLARFGKPATV
jgi:hypothetical protein